jgi:uncharacterized protein YbcC (UPF0753/DUF2309 family)
LRHRDLLLRSCGVDTDEWIHPVLIRFTSAFLDQGVAHRPMPGRDGGLHSCFLEIDGSRLARLCGTWAARLPGILHEERSRARDAPTSLEHSLAELGVTDDERESVLLEEALALRGWAGMVRQFEERPDRVPAIPVPARLIDFLAVRLLLTRAAVDHAARAHARLVVPLAELSTTLRGTLAVRPSRSPVERAWRLFHAAQLAGLDATAMAAHSVRRVATLEAELDAFDHTARRRLLHLAYERSLRHRLYDALVQLEPAAPPASPAFQAVFCIDEREESFRRHLEEVEPNAETLGTAGFFGVAMYFRGPSDARARPLCPANVQPDHYVTEVLFDQPDRTSSWQRARRYFEAVVGTNLHLGSRTLSRGALIMTTVGVLWAVPLILAVLFPWSRGRERRDRVRASRFRTRLCLDRTGEIPAMGRHAGFTKEEMAEIVAKQLAPLGIQRVGIPAASNCRASSPTDW